LNITHAAERRRFGERSLQSPSRFLDEIPGNLVEVLGRGTASRRRGRSAEGSEASFDYSYSQESADVDGEVQSGMRVRHPVFGDGVILEVIGGGVNQKLKIRFARVGVKTVMLRFANLELA
jgi:DNA helicase-2/ATP-dependent DNA helicase PcrA